MIIAMDARLMLRKLGAAEVYMVTSIQDAQAALQEHLLDFAMLDIGIGDTTSLDFASALYQAGVMFIFASGYRDTVPRNAPLGDPVVVTKPYNQAALAAAIRQTLERRQES